MSDAAFSRNILLFGRVLRSAGVDVAHARLLDAIRALTWTDVGSRADVAATLRSLLVHRHDDLARFDEAFDLFFRAHPPPSPGLPLFPLGERPRVVARPSPGFPVQIDLDDPLSSAVAPTKAVGASSAVAISRTKDFRDFSDAELERACALLEELPAALSRRRTRRWQRATGGGVDLRRVLRRSLMRGDLVDLPRRERREAPRPLLVFGDISGSMERYSRVLMHFVYGLTHGRGLVETFLFATALTRVTRRLAADRGSIAFARLAQDVRDWGGGTRLGDALRTFNTRWSRRVVRNGPIALIVSDGWDRGDPAVLDRELARLRRNCRRLIWLNPLLGSPRYQPLTRGMQAALRHIDDFLPAHNLAGLEQLAARLTTVQHGSTRNGYSGYVRAERAD